MTAAHEFSIENERVGTLKGENFKAQNRKHFSNDICDESGEVE